MSNKEYEYSEKIHATIINPYLSKDQFDDICDLIKKYSIRNISTSLLYLSDLKESLSNFKTNIKTYISYPLSDLPSNCLNDLINFAKEHGANEIEYIPKFFLLSKKDEEGFANDIEKVSLSNLPITLIFNKERLKNKYFKRALDISLELGIKNFQFGDGFSSQISFINIKEEPQAIPIAKINDQSITELFFTILIVYRLIRSISNYCYPFNFSYIWPIIRSCIMLTGSIVPKCNGIIFPTESTLILRN